MPLLMYIPVPWVFVLAYLVGVVLQAFIPIPYLARLAFWARSGRSRCYWRPSYM